LLRKHNRYDKRKAAPKKKDEEEKRGHVLLRMKERAAKREELNEWNNLEIKFGNLAPQRKPATWSGRKVRS